MFESEAPTTYTGVADWRIHLNSCVFVLSIHTPVEARCKKASDHVTLSGNARAWQEVWGCHYSVVRHTAECLSYRSPSKG
jgi:hypothetical protein